jgi:hypothetical protein
MPTINNQELYDKVKKYADTIYSKPSAYKSGFIVKKYKELGGTYTDDNKPKHLSRWYKEEWKDIGNQSYPVYRPTKRINKNTPLTPEEIKKNNLKKQIELKQIIKGEHNLPKFEGKGITNNSKSKDILEYSNPREVFKKAKEYLGDNVDIELSNNPKKKYMVLNPQTNKWIHFGQMGFQDFTKHKNPVRRHSYLQRTLFMRGNWKHNKYSPNNLSRNILW